jgi:RNA polymerase sigma-70 factor (ECF subfamily)
MTGQMSTASTAATMRQELVERARQGDRDAFGQLAAGEVDRLHAIARLVLRDADLAEDAVQEALVRCWRQLPHLRDLERFDGWLYRILIRTVADEHGRRRRHQATVQAIQVEPAVADGARELADRDQLEGAFRHLSIDHRAVVVLYHYVGLSLPEIAIALGIPPGTVKSRHHHAMAALRAALDAEARVADRTEALA